MSQTGGVVALLFTDLVGSTELLDRIGDDAAEELRHTHFSLLRGAVAQAGGREVKSLGDGHGELRQPRAGGGMRGGHAARHRGAGRLGFSSRAALARWVTASESPRPT